MNVSTSLWPLFGLRLRTARLELRLPDENDLAALAALAEEGVHDPELMPFAVPWTDVPPAERALSVLRWQWGRWAAWKPEDWGVDFAVVANGVVVGQQSLDAKDFAILREAGTGLWLGRRFQGQGFGTEMRAAVIHLAFMGLGATAVYSGAFTDNAASLGVSRKLGYQENGLERAVRRGKPASLHGLRLARETWQANPRIQVDITGLDACIDWFGIESA